MKYSTLFFDLDATLYPADNGLWDAIKDRMGLYMNEKLNLPQEEIPDLRKHYYRTYGTTLRGLQIHYQINPEDYLAYVHDIPLAEYLDPDPNLREVIASLHQKCWIFTNADSDYATRVVKYLQIDDCFEDIIDVRALDYSCKPDVIAYEIALSIAGETDPNNCVLFEDSIENLTIAHKLGFTTVLVSPNEKIRSGFDYQLRDISTLPSVFPDLWYI